MFNKNELPNGFLYSLELIDSEMNPLRREVVKAFFVSGVGLFVLCVIGLFALATLSIWGRGEQTWHYFFYLMVVSVLATSVYYVAIAFFGWVLLRKLKVS